MMASLSHDAQRYIDRYMRQVRAALSGHRHVDVDEVARDVRGHIDAELAASGGPITITHVQTVLERLGSPTQWEPAEDVPLWRRMAARMRSGPEDWRLAYLALFLFIAAPITVVFAPLIWLAAFITARATLALLAEHDEPVGPRTWLIYPALLFVYALIVVAVMFWPVMPAVMLSDDPSFDRFLRRVFPAPFEVTVGAAIALLLGLWWMIVGAVVRRSLAAVRAIFRPFADRLEPRHATQFSLFGLGIMLLAGAVYAIAMRYLQTA